MYTHKRAQTQMTHIHKHTYTRDAHTDIKQAFWHSSAHVLGQALELEFGADLTIGPALEEGFYYDCFLGDKVRLRSLL